MKDTKNNVYEVRILTHGGIYNPRLGYTVYQTIMDATFDMTEEQFKELQMAKKITEPKTEESTEQFRCEYIATPVYTNKAFSIQHAGNKRYDVVQIEFNEKGETSSTSVVESNLDIYEAQNAFRTHVVRAGLFTRKDVT